MNGTPVFRDNIRKLNGNMHTDANIHFTSTIYYSAYMKNTIKGTNSSFPKINA